MSTIHTPLCATRICSAAPTLCPTVKPPTSLWSTRARTPLTPTRAPPPRARPGRERLPRRRLARLQRLHRPPPLFRRRAPLLHRRPRHQRGTTPTRLINLSGGRARSRTHGHENPTRPSPPH